MSNVTALELALRAVTVMSTVKNLSSNTCVYNFGDYLDKRFILVAVVMTGVCVIGTLGNLLIICILLRPRMQSSSNWFLVMLAIFDTSVMVVTILLYSVEIIYDYMRSYELYVAWFSYVKVVYVLSHICQVATVSLTVAATVERFMSLYAPRCWRHSCSDSRALLWIGGLLICVIALTITKYWELTVVEELGCGNNFGRYTLGQSWLLQDKIYIVVYTVWLSNVIFVFLPFLVLAVFNALIFVRMRRHRIVLERQAHIADKLQCYRRHSTGGNGETLNNVVGRAKRGRRNREATVVLLVVVFVFLICNAPSVTLNIAEHLNVNVLKSHDFLYAISRDVINLLTVINSSANFVIYITFSRDFREEMVGMLFAPCRRMYRRVKPSFTPCSAGNSVAEEPETEDDDDDDDDDKPELLKACEAYGGSGDIIPYKKASRLSLSAGKKISKNYPNGNIARKVNGEIGVENRTCTKNYSAVNNKHTLNNNDTNFPDFPTDLKFQVPRNHVRNNSCIEALSGKYYERPPSYDNYRDSSKSAISPSLSSNQLSLAHVDHCFQEPCPVEPIHLDSLTPSSDYTAELPTTSKIYCPIDTETSFIDEALNSSINFSYSLHLTAKHRGATSHQRHRCNRPSQQRMIPHYHQHSMPQAPRQAQQNHKQPPENQHFGAHTSRGYHQKQQPEKIFFGVQNLSHFHQNHKQPKATNFEQHAQQRVPQQHYRPSWRSQQSDSPTDSECFSQHMPRCNEHCTATAPLLVSSNFCKSELDLQHRHDSCCDQEVSNYYPHNNVEIRQPIARCHSRSQQQLHCQQQWSGWNERTSVCEGINPWYPHQ